MLAPKAVKLSEYVAPHKPHTKLAEVLAKHKGHADWIEPVVDDDNLHADYISMGPGKKTPRRMNADTREWWVIQDGQIRFTIDGQEPFVASKGTSCRCRIAPCTRWKPSAIGRRCASK